MKISLILLLVCCFLSIKAQTNFLPGYVITLENDTLHGLIDYRSEIRNARRCDFREKATDPVREFLPEEIKAFRFTDSKCYVSKWVTIDSLRTPVFLECLVDGIYDLFFLNDGMSSHYFIANQEGQMTELTNKVSYIRKSDREYALQQKKYIGILKVVFADCRQLDPMINSAKLEDRSLIAITSKYHEYVCDGEKCIIYKKKVPAVKITWGAYIAANVSVFSFSDNTLFEVLNTDVSRYPTAGMLLNTSLPKANEKLSFQISCEYGRAYFHNTGIPPFTADFEEIHLHTSILKTKGGFKYTWPKGKLRPTAMAGAHYLRMLINEAVRVEDKVTFNTIYSNKYVDSPHTEKLLGLNFDLGMDYHYNSSFIPFVTLSIEQSRGYGNFTIVPTVNTKINTLQVHAGIYF